MCQGSGVSCSPVVPGGAGALVQGVEYFRRSLVLGPGVQELLELLGPGLGHALVAVGALPGAQEFTPDPVDPGADGPAGAGLVLVRFPGAIQIAHASAGQLSAPGAYGGGVPESVPGAAPYVQDIDGCAVLRPDFKGSTDHIFLLFRP